MAAMQADLEAYCARIGYGGERSPTAATLHALHGLHTRAIPFENLSPFLGEPVRLDPQSLQDKLVRRKRGGWCFEQNLLFTHMLRALGFDVKTLAARVRWNVPPEVTPARSHMLMLVSIAGERYIADVGFGGITLTAPLKLVADVEQATLHEPHRLVATGDAYTLEAKVGASWQALYVFDLYEQIQADYEVSNWYLANNPQSQFVTGILAARADIGRRHTLRNTRYSIHSSNGETERRFIGSVAEMKSVLQGPMQIPLPQPADLDARFQKVIDANPAT
jgi:N-hydroxyarylamine O-acetyltransferase